MTAPIRQNISQQAVPIIQRIYDLHAAGCCWHLVLDDDNLDSIEFCRQWSEDAILPGAEFPCETQGACQELAKLDLTPSIIKRAVKQVNFQCAQGIWIRRLHTS